jgi:hypothetical protein
MEVVRLFHHQLKVNTFIEGVIRNGFKIPFETLPSSVYLKNNLSSVKHHKFVSSAMSELLEKQSVIEVKSKPFCVNPLTVSVNSVTTDLNFCKNCLLRNAYKKNCK